MQEKEIEKLFYIDKNYSEIKEILKNNSDSRSFIMLGKIELIEGNLTTAELLFKKANYIYGCAYCHFLNNEIEKAKILLNLIKGSSSAVDWLIFLISLIEDNANENPTYFQIRNFYEQDLNMLFIYKNNDVINKIMKENKYLEYFNREIYKYTGRVLLNNNYIEIAEKFLLKSIDIFYKDPETHYMLGEIYEKQNRLNLAIKEYKTADEVNNGYLPATKKVKELSTN